MAAAATVDPGKTAFEYAPARAGLVSPSAYAV